MPTTITAFNKEITIHPQYYYNTTKITNNPQHALNNVAMISLAIPFSVINAALPSIVFISVMDIFIDMPLSSKNTALVTTVFFSIFNIIAITTMYIDANTSLENFAQDSQNLMHYEHDAVLFSLEYAVDQAFEFMS